MKKFILTFGILALFSMSALAQERPDAESKEIIGLNSAFMYNMLEANQNLRKVDILLKARKKEVFKKEKLILGASFIAIADYQRSNTNSKFAYLMRHPTAKNQIGKTVTEAVIHSFQFAAAGAVNSWLAVYAEILYNPEQNFGPGNITSIGRNQLMLRKGYVVVGNLEEFPVYGAIGKMDAPFGQTGSVSPFTNSTMWHAFGGLGYGVQIGLKKWGLHATVMAVQGGSQFRAMNTPVGDSTNVPSKLNNFVVDLNYTFEPANNISFKVGASYLHGSTYCQDFPVTHFTACKDNNPAITAYGKFSFHDRVIAMGSYATTTQIWPGTHNTTPPLNKFVASKVTSLDVGVKYIFNRGEQVHYVASAEFSNFRAGPDGAPWERQNQMVAGFSTLIQQSSKIFIELFRTAGYCPLNFISGSKPNEPFPPGVTHTDSSVRSFGIVIGGQITI